jgi:hypothetical protein
LIEGFLSFLKNNPTASQHSKLYFVGKYSVQQRLFERFYEPSKHCH